MNISEVLDQSSGMTTTKIVPGSLVVVTDPRLLKTQFGIVISLYWYGPLVLTPVSFGTIKPNYITLA